MKVTDKPRTKIKHWVLYNDLGDMIRKIPVSEAPDLRAAEKIADKYCENHGRVHLERIQIHKSIVRSVEPLRLSLIHI